MTSVDSNHQDGLERMRRHQHATHMEEAGAEVDARDVGRDVVDELAVGDDRPRLAAEDEAPAVDSGDERTASEDSRSGRPDEKLVDREGRDDLHDPQGKREPDAEPDVRVGVPWDAAMRVVALGSKVDERLRDEWRRDLGDIADDFDDYGRGMVSKHVVHEGVDDRALPALQNW